MSKLAGDRSGEYRSAGHRGDTPLLVYIYVVPELGGRKVRPALWMDEYAPIGPEVKNEMSEHAPHRHC